LRKDGIRLSYFFTFNLEGKIGMSLSIKLYSKNKYRLLLVPLVLLALAVVARCGSMASAGADPDPLEGVVADAV
jgi:hypothetical protein